jgi:hypothetical protein
MTAEKKVYPRKVHPNGGPKAVKKNQCKARTKTCGKCGYRFQKGDPDAHCPECKFDRRCKRAALLGTTVCRLHGGKGALASMKEPRTFVARNLSAAYNRLINMPDLLNLSHEMATLVAAEEEMHHKMDDAVEKAAMNPNSAHDALMMFEAILAEAYVPRRKDEMLDFAKNGQAGWIKVDQLRRSIAALRDAIEPELVREYYMTKLRGIIQEAGKVSDIERKHLALSQTMVPVQHVYELLVAFERVTLKYIRDQDERLQYVLDLKRAIPIDVTPTVPSE